MIKSYEIYERFENFMGALKRISQLLRDLDVERKADEVERLAQEIQDKSSGILPKSPQELLMTDDEVVKQSLQDTIQSLNYLINSEVKPKVDQRIKQETSEENIDQEILDIEATKNSLSSLLKELERANTIILGKNVPYVNFDNLDKSLKKKLEDINIKAENFVQKWQDTVEKISIDLHLKEDEMTDINQYSDQICQALGQLKRDLEELPTLFITVAGTTSSGKSTLVNLLCGTEVVPSAEAADTTLGVIEIEFADNLTSGKEISRKLLEDMKKYRNLEGDCPIYKEKYPFRFWKVTDPTLLSSPIPREKSQTEKIDSLKVNLVDLPGLTSRKNQFPEAVQEKFKNSLCIVVCDSAGNSDPDRETELLSKVLDRIISLGSYPERVFFVIHKIDLIERDREQFTPEEREHRIKSFKTKIKAFMYEKLLEYDQNLFGHDELCKDDVDTNIPEKIKEYVETKVPIVELSSLPALLAIELKSYNDKDIEIDDDLFEKVNQMTHILTDSMTAMDVSKALLKTNEESKSTRKKIAYKLWEKSRSEAFHTSLMRHIESHLPQLIIPQIIDKFKNSQKNSTDIGPIKGLELLVKASQDERDQYEERLKQIEIFPSLLEEKLNETGNKWRNPLFKVFDALQKIASSENMTERATLVLEISSNIQSKDSSTERRSRSILALAIQEYLEPGEPYKSLDVNLKRRNNKLGLFNLYEWESEIFDKMDKALDDYIAAIEELKVGEDYMYAQRIKDKLERRFEALKTQGYNIDTAKKGSSKTLKALFPHEKKNLKELCENIEGLVRDIDEELKAIRKDILRSEQRKIDNLIKEIFKQRIEDMRKDCKSVVEKIGLDVKLFEISQDFFYNPSPLDLISICESSLKVNKSAEKFKLLNISIPFLELDTLNQPLPSARELLSENFKKRITDEVLKISMTIGKSLADAFKDARERVIECQDDQLDKYRKSLEKFKDREDRFKDTQIDLDSLYNRVEKDIQDLKASFDEISVENITADS